MSGLNKRNKGSCIYMYKSTEALSNQYDLSFSVSFLIIQTVAEEWPTHMHTMQ